MQISKNIFKTLFIQIHKIILCFEIWFKKINKNTFDNELNYQKSSYSMARVFVCPIGALIVWIIKGFKSRFNDELSNENEDRNFSVGILTLMIGSMIFGLFKVFQNSD